VTTLTVRHYPTAWPRFAQFLQPGGGRLGQTVPRDAIRHSPADSPPSTGGRCLPSYTRRIRMYPASQKPTV